MLGLALAAASAVFNGSFGVLAKLPAVQRANVSAGPRQLCCCWWWGGEVVVGGARGARGVVVRGVGKELVGGRSSAFDYSNSITQNAPLLTTLHTAPADASSAVAVSPCGLLGRLRHAAGHPSNAARLLLRAGLSHCV